MSSYPYTSRILGDYMVIGYTTEKKSMVDNRQIKYNSVLSWIEMSSVFSELISRKLIYANFKKI